MDTSGDGASTTVLQVAGFLNSFMSELHNFKYYLSFIFLTSLTLFLVYIIQKIRRSLTNKDSLIVILLTLFGCFMVVYVIIIGGGKLSGLWTQGTSNNCEQRTYKCESLSLSWTGLMGWVSCIVFTYFSQSRHLIYCPVLRREFMIKLPEISGLVAA